MKNRIHTAFVPVLLFLLSGVITSVQAQTYDAYFSANLGFAMPLDSETTDSEEPGLVFDLGFDNDIAISGAVGLRMESLRAEAEISYQKNDLDKIGVTGITVDASALGISGNAKALTGLINAYFDFNTGSAFSPYITGGMGFSRVNFNASIDIEDELGTLDDNDTGFAFQLGAGVGYAVSDNVTLDLRYRYFSVPTLKYDTTESETESEFNSHNITGGVRISF